MFFLMSKSLIIFDGVRYLMHQSDCNFKLKLRSYDHQDLNLAITLLRENEKWVLGRQGNLATKKNFQIHNQHAKKP